MLKLLEKTKQKASQRLGFRLKCIIVVISETMGIMAYLSFVLN